MRSCLLAFLSLTLLITACNNHRDKSQEIYKLMNESLVNSNTLLMRGSELLHDNIQDKMNDLTTSYKAAIWLPKAEEVSQISLGMYNYIDSLEQELKTKAGFDAGNQDELYDKNNNDVVKRFFGDERRRQLLTKLHEYKQALIDVDSSFYEYFNDDIIIADSFNLSPQKQIFGTLLFQENITLPEALLLFTRFQNHIELIENKLLQYCANKIPGSEDYTSYSAIVGQSSSHIWQGDSIEIAAGIGAFSTNPKPDITIGGKYIELDEAGVANYKLKPVNGIGKQFIPVSICYKDQDGKIVTIEKKVEFSVDRRR